MKHIEKHISRFFITVAILVAFGNVAFAEAPKAQKEVSEVSTLQQDDQGNPIVLKKVSVGDISQTISQNEHLGFGLFGTFSSAQDLSFNSVSATCNTAYFIKDKRELIFRYLFPSHFFWWFFDDFLAVFESIFKRFSI